MKPLIYKIVETGIYEDGLAIGYKQKKYVQDENGIFVPVIPIQEIETLFDNRTVKN